MKHNPYEPTYPGRGAYVFSKLTDKLILPKKPATDCWLWSGTRDIEGYPLLNVYPGRELARLGVNVITYRVNRLISEYYHGAEVYPRPGPRVKNGWVAMHNCDNPQCISPYHILPGTQSKNLKDSVARGRKGLTGIADPKVAAMYRQKQLDGLRAYYRNRNK